ncbi:hypothetical protein AA0472_1488 [Acetobacter estunensis NRIC 0472]|nr:hypothetical protein AA0472_1488 [Acetobacter estunensis NRIC 0472]
MIFQTGSNLMSESPTFFVDENVGISDISPSPTRAMENEMHHIRPERHAVDVALQDLMAHAGDADAAGP